MGDFDAWSILVDVGCISGLLLVGKIIRAKVGIAQRLMLPASIIAGVLGLALGPYGLNLIPFSDQLNTYTTILVAVVFGAIPLAGGLDAKGVAKGARAMWSYSVAGYVLQWGVCLLFALGVLNLFWDLPDAFGMLVPAGWVGGFGTVAAMSPTIADAGMEEFQTLGFTSATFGMVASIVVGLALVKWGVRKGVVQEISSFDQLPESLRTGLLRDDAERAPIGRATTSPNSLEPLALPMTVIGLVVLGGYMLSEGIKALFPSISVPVFAMAMLVGLVAGVIIKRTPARSYVDGTTVNSLSGTATDYLVAFGIAAIVPSVVVDNIVPLLLLTLVGLAYCLFMFFVVTPRVFGERWFERGIFTWGWAAGSTPSGIALLRIVDPKQKSKVIEEYGLAYMAYAPFEIGTVIIAPLVVVAGLVWPFTGISLLVGAGVLVLAFALRWAGARAFATAEGDAAPVTKGA
ncbi:sodium/glutamate symporter [Marinactinospora thermotolerans]|uniref:Glutamate:Na+ symporter, ESS family n=1 Tax=Marinactinospora thermotolerans DSM 45154 TaxID=1122192 RepID=A0A1T4M1P4_9ACTN|nr:sodium/glutamate symporter [Marinactinospora thermotolerans]SJZ60698.1 glutamate:Na+ symporter, ESS family [Marinactinospora thermotolerans DSM 45154]